MKNILLLWLLSSLTLGAEGLTLRSLGAKGDGVTDDTAAIVQALTANAGKSIDGEGLTYAVKGSVRLGVDVDLRNATIKQTAGSFDTAKYIRSAETRERPLVEPADAFIKMAGSWPILTAAGVATYPEDPVVPEPDLTAIREMLNVRTLFIQGEGRPVAVKLENVKILRGDHADAGMHSNAAGLYLVNVEPLILNKVEISGNGKGAGLFVTNARKVRMDGVHVHDILWAPYQGDVAPTLAMLEETGWNGMPIYDFDEKEGRFIRVRIQEQTNGIVLSNAEDVEIVNCRVERIGAMVEGKFYPWQADGFTMGAVKNLVMRDCTISDVWEGIDLTGQGVDGFVQENITISDTFAFGFKYAHPQKNGKVVNCVSTRAGLAGYTIGSESENIEFINCQALETGADSHWVVKGRPDAIAGFEVMGDGVQNARNITIKDCVAENKKFRKAMAYGFRCAKPASEPELSNRLINPKGGGAKEGLVQNFRRERK